MEEYLKVKKIQKISCLVGCLNKFSSQNIEIILIFIHLIIIIFCIMNLFIIPWSILKSALLSLRVVIIVFLSISLIFICFVIICRKRKQLKNITFYNISFYGSLLSIGLLILDFFFIFISLIIVFVKLKNYTAKRYDYNSVLAIDIFTILILIPILFFWYAVILNIYAKIDSDENLKDYIDSKIKFFNSQNAKIVNVELGQRKKIYEDEIIAKNLDNEDIISNNKIEMNSEKPHESRNKSNYINNSLNKNNQASQDSLK